jgi:starch synthase
MKILILVQDWISFYNQAEALATGLKDLGVEHKLVRLADVEGTKSEVWKYKPEVVVGVGSWHSYEPFVKWPRELGLKALPWIVSDEVVEGYVEEYNQLRLIATPSNYCENVFIKYGIKEEIIEIMPEAVDPQLWSCVPVKEREDFLDLLSIRSSFPLAKKMDLVKLKKEKVPFLLTTGGDASSKGAQEVIKALAKLDKKIPWIYLIKVWPQIQTFRQIVEEYEMIKEHGLEDRIRYMVTDFSQQFMRKLFSICDIYVAPSKSEGFGLPFVQAQMAGKPIISINALSIKDVVVNGKTGWLAKPVREDGKLKADVDDLAVYLEKLLLDEEMRREMGWAARKYAYANYEPKVIAGRLLKLISYLD